MIASEKKVPSVLVDVKSVEKISYITNNIGVTYSGMGPDNRVLLARARKAAQKYYLQYKDPIPVSQLGMALRICIGISQTQCAAQHVRAARRLGNTQCSVAAVLLQCVRSRRWRRSSRSRGMRRVGVGAGVHSPLRRGII